MSSSNNNQIIEHVVLFKVNPTADPTSVSAMITKINSLASLDPVLHLSAGPVLRCRSKSLTFTHMLHSRYKSKSDLTEYADHPSHVSVVANYVKPVADDVMAVDWVAEGFSGPVGICPGSGLRVMVGKMKEEKKGCEEVLGFMRRSGRNVSVGENFSVGRNKGYEVCSIAVFDKGVEELEVEEGEELGEVGEFLDDLVVVDYVVAAPGAC